MNRSWGTGDFCGNVCMGGGGDKSFGSALVVMHGPPVSLSPAARGERVRMCPQMKVRRQFLVHYRDIVDDEEVERACLYDDLWEALETTTGLVKARQAMALQAVQVGEMYFQESDVIWKHFGELFIVTGEGIGRKDVLTEEQRQRVHLKGLGALQVGPPDCALGCAALHWGAALPCLRSSCFDVPSAHSTTAHARPPRPKWKS